MASTLDEPETPNVVEDTGNALDLPDDLEQQAQNLGNDGFRLWEMYQESNRLEDLDEVIRLHQKALDRTPEGHADRAWRLATLGFSYGARFRHSGNCDDLSEAIRLEQNTLALTSEGHPNRAQRIQNLGTSFHARFMYNGQPEDISEAIKLFQNALDLTPERHADRAQRLQSLGASFYARFVYNGQSGDIADAIKLFKNALDLTPEGHADRAKRMHSLGASFHARFKYNGQPSDTSEAIKLLQNALDLTAEGHADRAQMMTSLGASFHARFMYTRQPGDLSEAVRLKRNALDLTPEGHADRAQRMHSLAASFHARFMYTRQLGDLSEAIILDQNALDLTPEGHADKAQRMQHLGTSFYARFEYTRQPRDIAEAIRLNQNALDLTPEGHADRAQRMQSLGISLYARFEDTQCPDDLTEAIGLYQHALLSLPEGHPYAASLMLNLGHSHATYFDFTGKQNTQLCITAANHFSAAAHCISATPSRRLASIEPWIDCLNVLGDSNAIRLAYTTAFNLMSLVCGIDQTISQRHFCLNDLYMIFPDAISWALTMNDYITALEWLEQGRCLIWSQVNQLRTPLDALKKQHSHLADEFQQVSKALDIAGSRSIPEWTSESTLKQKIHAENSAREHLHLASRQQQLLEEIRSIPEFHDFLCPRSACSLFSELPRDGPVILISVLPDRCDALALLNGADEPIHIPLPNFSFFKADQLRIKLRTLLVGHNLRMHNDDTSRAGRKREGPKQEKLNPILRALWDDVVKPVLENLAYNLNSPPAQKKRIWWCAMGPLALLPLHAAGIYDQKSNQPESHLYDFVISSYIPTVSTLLDKANISKALKHIPTQIFLLAQPNTPQQHPIKETVTETKLTLTKMEMHSIPTTLIVGKDGTVNRVQQELKSHDWVHFACHGLQHPTNPLQSAFFLEDGCLELLDIIRHHNPNSKFAYLSACQTSSGDDKLTDEVFHLAAGMLAAGFCGVAATMWSIKDKYAPGVASDFYNHVLEASKNEEGSAKHLDCRKAAYAHDYALQCLRDLLQKEVEAGEIDMEDALLIWAPFIHLGI